MFYNTLGFQLHSKCYCNCEVCCMSCEYNSREELSIEIIKDAINQAQYERHIKHVSFSGGDPFLRKRELIQLIEYANAKGFETSCFTNALWCNEYGETLKYLKELDKVGLKILRISMDHQHNKDLKTNRYINLFKALKETKIKSYVNVGVLNTSDDRTFEFLDEIKEYLLNQEIIVYPFMRLGKAENLPEKNFFYTIQKNNLVCPRNPILGVRANGSVYSCEMSPNNTFPIGNIYYDSLRDIINRTHLDNYHRLVISKGLKWIVNKFDDSKMIVPEKFVSPCEFCKWANDRSDILMELYKEVGYI